MWFSQLKPWSVGIKVFRRGHVFISHIFTYHGTCTRATFGLVWGIKFNSFLPYFLLYSPIPISIYPYLSTNKRTNTHDISHAINICIGKNRILVGEREQNSDGRQLPTSEREAQHDVYLTALRLASRRRETGYREKIGERP